MAHGNVCIVAMYLGFVLRSLSVGLSICTHHYGLWVVHTLLLQLSAGSVYYEVGRENPFAS